MYTLCVGSGKGRQNEKLNTVVTSIYEYSTGGTEIVEKNANRRRKSCGCCGSICLPLWYNWLAARAASPNPSDLDELTLTV
jgi:hypothetical protein